MHNNAALTRRIAASAALLAAISTLHGATLTFDGGTAGTGRTWSAGANWDSNTAPAVGDDLVIGGTALSEGVASIANGSYMALSSNASAYTATVRSVTFDNSLDQFAGGTLDLRNSSASTAQAATLAFNTADVTAITVIGGDVAVSSRTSSAQMTVNLAYTGLAAFSIDEGSTLTFTTVSGGGAMVYGTGGITKTGAGTLYLNAASGAANTYAGGTVIEAGVVQVGATGSLGTGAVQLGVSGGAAASLISLRAGWNYANAITVSSGTLGALTIGNNSGTGNFNTTYSGAIAVNGDLTVLGQSAATYALRFTGAMSGTGDITKTGAGEWRIENTANTWRGNLAINEGSVTLLENANLTFALGEAGATNSVSGVGTAVFNGVFVIDDSALSTTTGSWLLVDAGTLTTTFGSSFTLRLLNEAESFTDAGGGLYQFESWSFDTLTGTLSASAVPEPSAFAALAGLAGLGAAALRRRRRA